MDNNLERYHKYKRDYLAEKYGDPVLDKGVQIGGGTPVFDNMASMFIMVTIRDPVVKKSYNKKIMKLLGKNNRPENDLLHFTLLNIIINEDHADSDIFKEKRFLRHIRRSFDEYLVGTTLTPTKYKLLGVSKKFFAKVYRPDDQEDISDFRVSIYKYLNKGLGTFKRGYYEIDGVEYYIYSFNGEELYAVTGFHHGRTIWVPHLSIVSDKDISIHNEKLFNKYEKKKTDDDKKNLLVGVVGVNRERSIRLSKKDKLVVSYFNKSSGEQKHYEL